MNTKQTQINTTITNKDGAPNFLEIRSFLSPLFVFLVCMFMLHTHIYLGTDHLTHMHKTLLLFVDMTALSPFVFYIFYNSVVFYIFSLRKRKYPSKITKFISLFLDRLLRILRNKNTIYSYLEPILVLLLFISTWSIILGYAYLTSSEPPPDATNLETIEYKLIFVTNSKIKLNAPEGLNKVKANFLSPASRKTLLLLHESTRHNHKKKILEFLILLNDGWSNKDLAKKLSVDEQILHTYWKNFQENNIELFW